MRQSCGFLFVVFVLVSSGCAAAAGGGGGGGSDGGPSTADGGPTGSIDAGPSTPMARDSGLSACASSSVEATSGIAPIDIVWVVDSSGSMGNEARRVQNNLNAFSTAMGRVGIDFRVVMITTSSYVTVPAPLGTGEHYRLLDREVSSSESLRVLLAELPRYQDFLREGAVMHFVAVTDDESDLSADDFYASMQEMLGKHFTFHAIASEEGPRSATNPDGACRTSTGFPPEGAASPGKQYYRLAGITGGRTFSICAEDWESLFGDLTAAIAVPMRLSCVYDVPPPPEGEELDPFLVNVVYRAGSGEETVLPYVQTSDGPDCTRGGWYYDDPDAPTSVRLCPTTCSEIEGDTEGRVDIAFGCATQII